jgi:hypothetical protein
MKRKHDMVKVAETRARVVALLNSGIGLDRSITDIANELEIEAEHRKGFASLIYRMADNHLIRKNKTTEGVTFSPIASDYVPGADVLSSVDKFVAGISPAKRPYAKSAKAPVKVLDMLAGLTIDISKTTGRIRLTTNGLTIDIGVIA